MSPRVTVGLTPVLTEMLASGEFKEEFKEYLRQKISSASKDIEEFERIGESHMSAVARMWQDFYSSRYSDFTERYADDIVGAYRTLQDEGHIEIITSGATHGYFPLLSKDTSIQVQVKQAIRSYRRHFGRDPVGMWLPECAYRPSYSWARPEEGETGETYLRKGVEEFLSENGIKYFFIDSHLLKGGKAIGVYLDRFEDLKKLWSRFAEQYKPLPEDTEKTPYKVYWVGVEAEGRAPVAVFTRDPKTGRQVWSGEWGYPGDGNYLDFHKKRFPGGLKYWKVTDCNADLADKGPYHPENAYARLPENAGHFKELIKDNLRGHLESTGQEGIVVSPYDAELFGHWWFEGPEWIYHVIKYIYMDGFVRPVTTGEYLEETRPMEVITLPEGSWGEGGYHWIWLNDMNRWTWKHIYEAEDKMHELVSGCGERIEDKELEDILKQAARELLLLQSSDWQFLISTRSATDYAEGRIVRHYEDFKRLAAMAEKKARGEALSEGDRNFLKLLMARDAIFPDIEPHWFKEVEFAAL
jgi:1,4-alpha-glucan branching enzyme